MPYRYYLAILLLGFALACGGSESNSSSSSAVTSVEGVLDFDSVDDALEKARANASSPTSGNVFLTNVDSGEITTVAFSGNTFGANVAPGDYEIFARRNDDVQLRSYLPSVSRDQDNEIELDINSTAAAALIDSVDDYDMRSIEVIRQFASEEQSNASDNVMYMLLLMKKEVKDRAAAGGNIQEIVDDYPDTDAVVAGVRTVGAGLIAHLGDVEYDGVVVNSDNIDLSGFSLSGVDISFPVPTTSEKIVVMQVAADYTSSAVTVLDALSGNLQKRNFNTYPISDVTIDVYGRHVYPIGRFFADFVEKRDVDNLGVNLFGRSVSTLDSDETDSLNPHALIFASSSQALLTRYGSGIQWIVNPSSAGSFKVAEVDLSAYDSDTVPEFSQGVFTENKYFVAAQRLTSFLPSDNAYLAVIDTDGNEVDTGMAAAGSNLLGIELPTRNPGKVLVHEASGNILVQCVGQYGASWNGSNRVFNGGIVSVDPTTYEATILVDDDGGADESTDVLTGGGSYGGLISDVALVSASKGYLVTYSGWQSNGLRSFNPVTGVVGDVIEGFDGVNISAIAADSAGQLFVGGGAQIKILDTTTDTVTKTVELDLNVSNLKVLSY